MRTALADFKGSLDRVKDITDHIDANISAALADVTVLNRHEYMQCSAMVTLSGFLESFLKEVAERFIAAVCALNRPFAVLPEKMRYAHYEYGGRTLVRRAQDERAGRPSRITATSADIASRLSSVGTVPYGLVWEAFADTRANPRPEIMAEYLKKFGIQSPWLKIGAKAARSPSTLKLQLESFLSLRHECAHTGTATSVPTPDDIRQFIDLFWLLGKSIVAVLEDHLATM